jgi:hypothetical protein
MEIYTFDDKLIEQRLEEYRAILKTDNYDADFKELLQENETRMTLCKVIWRNPQLSGTEGNI